MKTQLKVLNSKEVKALHTQIQEQWGYTKKLECAFLQNQKNKIYIINKSIGLIDTSKLRINSMGTYFCEIGKIGIRLSIEGSQIIGPHATNNVFEITEKQSQQWMIGEDLKIDGDYSGFVILKYKNYFLGCGQFKEQRLLNYVGKERRIATQLT